MFFWIIHSRLVAADKVGISVTTDRTRQRHCARLAVIFAWACALISVFTVEHAAAVTTVEPQVQIGESRSIERSQPAIVSTSDDPAVTDDAPVAGVAVAGVAIARAAPLSPRLDTGIANPGNNPLPLVIALTAEAAMIAILWQRSRRTIL